MSPAKTLAAAVGAAMFAVAPSYAQAPTSFAVTGVRVSEGEKVIPRATVAGSGPQGRAILFDTSSPRPKQVPFTFSGEWQEVRAPIVSFKGINPKAVVGVVISTDPTKGPFAFELDDVRLE